MKIKLLNGRDMECIPGTKFYERHVSIRSDETNIIFNLFKESVWLILNNSERIMNDSRMFLTPIYSQSFSPFFSNSRPRIGTFLEWWLQYPEYSRDKYGNPIYCISGNPMTGSHSCHAIDIEGNYRKATEKSFLHILTSFGRVNSLYKNAKLTCKCYDLLDVINILRNNGLEDESHNQLDLDNK